MGEKKKELTHQKLRSILDEILAKAEGNSLHIEKEDVIRSFDGYELSDPQMKLVLDYLLSKKVQIGGYHRTLQETPDSGKEYVPASEEQEFLDTYEEDLKKIPSEKKDEWQELLPALQAGKPEAKRRAAELLLVDILQEAKKMAGRDMMIQDLIQEGSLQLVLSADELDYGAFDSGTEVRKKLFSLAEERMESASAEQQDVHSRDRKFVEKVENFKNGVSVLKEEYGRRIYLDEVADFLSITEEEAENILRLAGEDVPQDQEDGN